MIRILVGTDVRQGRAEIALENSIRANTSADVDITWMRAHEGEWKKWRHAPDRPMRGGGAWATCFTNFRYSIPALCNYEGRAIYLDSDMLVLGDIAELWNLRPKGAWCSLNPKRTDVSIIDCAWFKGKKWWPSLEQMQASNMPGALYRQLLLRNGAFSHEIDERWDHLDDYRKDWTKLIHFTNMRTQPWRPWPEAMGYSKHRCQEAVALWESYARSPSTKSETSASESP